MVYFAKSLTGDSRSALGTDIPTYDAWMAGSNVRLEIMFNVQRCMLRQCLGRGFKHLLFSPLPGEMIQFD